MKYFTPELLSRIQSRNADVSAQAHDEWERAIVRFNRRWNKIKSGFPKAVRRFEEEQVCLHDALVLCVARQDHLLVMILAMEPPSRNLAILTFRVIGDPEIHGAAMPAVHTSCPVTWLYEEFDLDRRGRCCFEVLLSNAWTVRLHFRDFQFQVLTPVFPPLDGRAKRERLEPTLHGRL